MVFGKGIGFPPVPYDLDDLSRIDRTFYDVDPRYFGMIAELPQPIVLASADIAELAQVELRCPLNPNLTFTLADHLSFAAERLRKGLALPTPLAYDVRHLYPKEAALGDRALAILAEQTGIMLPDHEAINVAMHLINSEVESEDLKSVMMTLKVITEVEKIIEDDLGSRFDHESYDYNRFAMHLRYLIQRLASGTEIEERDSDMLRTLAREYPDIYLCSIKVMTYLDKTWGWRCNDEETDKSPHYECWIWMFETRLRSGSTGKSPHHKCWVWMS